MITITPTEEQLKEMKKQAKELGTIFTSVYPGTTYNEDTMMWDYSNNPELIKLLNVPAPYVVDLSCFTQLFGVNA